MDIDHVHFYVRDAISTRTWFVQKLGFQAVASHTTTHTQTEVVRSGPVIFLLSAALTPRSEIATYLQQHPPGIADVVLRVPNLEAAVQRADRAGAAILQPVCLQPEGSRKWAQIQGWRSLRHTLVEQALDGPAKSAIGQAPPVPTLSYLGLMGIDHVVLNVSAGQLTAAVQWYERVLGLECRQTFAIQTERSGLCSQVLVHPKGSVQFPINEPASENSQIQEFLDHNRGSGIQHIALRTHNILTANAHLKRRGLRFLSVPPAYYEDLNRRPGFLPKALDWGAIAAQEILVDWRSENPHAVLLQTFTQPIFEEPTFFFELIERQAYLGPAGYQQAEGFGEGNFQALFEAMEQEQLKRHFVRG